MSIQKEIYPVSTEDGKSIPLDVVMPLSSVRATLAANVETTIVPTALYDIISIYSSIDVAVDFAGVLEYPMANNTLVDDTILIPANTLMTLRAPESVSWSIVPLKNDSAGFIYITALQKWAGLRLNRQLAKI